VSSVSQRQLHEPLGTTKGLLKTMGFKKTMEGM